MFTCCTAGEDSADDNNSGTTEGCDDVDELDDDDDDVSAFDQSQIDDRHLQHQQTGSNWPIMIVTSSSPPPSSSGVVSEDLTLKAKAKDSNFVFKDTSRPRTRAKNNSAVLSSSSSSSSSSVAAAAAAAAAANWIQWWEWNSANSEHESRLRCLYAWLCPENIWRDVSTFNFAPSNATL